MAKRINELDLNLAITADTKKAKEQLEELKQQLSDLTNFNSNKKFGIEENIQKATVAAAQLKVQLEEATDKTTGKLDLSSFYNQLNKSGMTLEKYQTELSALGPSGTKAFAELASSIANADLKLNRANSSLNNFAVSLKNAARWQISSTLLHGFMGSIQSAYGYAKDLNESLTNIGMVTGRNVDQMAKFAEQANKAAQSLSTTTTAYTDAALIFYQQGLSDKEVEARTNATIKMSQVTGDTATDVSSYMTAIWNNFAKGSDNLEHFADVITALGASTASSSAEISEGLSKFASVAETIGLSYDYSTSALATIIANTRQSAESVGTGLRTVFSRLESLSLGETLDDGVNLTKYTKALKTVGVDILDTSGQLKKMDSILDELSEKWVNLSESQQVALAQTVGGVRQYTTLVALMNNWGDMEKNLATVKNSDGTLQKQADIYAESWEASRKRVKAAAQEIYSSLIDKDFFINLNEIFAKFLSVISGTIKGLGGLKGVLLAVGSIATSVFQDQITSGLERLGTNIYTSTSKGKKEIESIRDKANDILINNGYSDGTFAGQGQAAAYRAIGEAQRSYRENAEKMTEEQRKISQLLLDQNKSMAEGVVKESELLKEKQSELDADKKIFEIRNGFTSKRNSTAYDNLKQLVKDQKQSGQVTRVSALLEDANEKIIDVKPDSEETKKGLEELYLILTSLQKGFKDLNIEMKDALGPEIAAKINTLTNSFKDGEFVGKIQDVSETIKKIDEASYEIGVKSAKSIDKFVTDNNLTESQENQLLDLMESYSKVGSAQIDLVGRTGTLGTALDGLKNKFKENTETPMTMSAALTQTSSAIMAFGSVLRSVNGLINTWQDSTSSLGDKLISTVTTVGMLVPSIISLSSAISKANMSVTLFNTTIALTFGQIALLVGAVAALGVALSVAIKYSPKNMFKEASEAADEAKNSFDEAKSSYDSLIDSIESYQEAKNSIKELRVGTEEWTESIKDANEQALELLRLFPELSNSDFLKTDENGLLNISNEGLEEIKRLKQESVNNASNVSSLAQINKNNKEIDYETYKTAHGAGISSEDLNKAILAIQKNGEGIFESSNTLANSLAEVGLNDAYLIDALISNKDEIIKLNESNNSLAKANEIFYNSIVDSSLSTNESYSNLSNGFKDAIQKISSSELSSKTDKLAKEKYSAIRDKDIQSEYAKLMGWDVSSITNKFNGTGVYNFADGTQKTVSDSEARAALAQAEVLEELNDNISSYVQGLNNVFKEAEDLSKGLGDSILTFAGGNGGDFFDLTLSELGKVEEALNGEEKTKIVSAWRGLGYESEEAYEEALNQAVENYKKTAENISNSLNSRSFVKNEFEGLKKTNRGLENATLNEQQSVANSLAETFKTGGAEATSALTELFDQVKASGGSLEDFSTILSSIDWSSGKGIEELRKALSDANIRIYEGTDAWKDYTVQMEANAASASALINSFEDLKNTFKDIADIKDNISFGSVISDEDYQKLIDYDASLSEMFREASGGKKFLGDIDLLNQKLSISSSQIADLKQKFEDMSSTGANLGALNVGNNSDVDFSSMTYSSGDLEGTLIESEKYQTIVQSMVDSSSLFGEVFKEAKLSIDEVTASLDILAQESAGTFAGSQEELAEAQQRINDVLAAAGDIQDNYIAGLYESSRAEEVAATSVSNLYELRRLANEGSINGDAYIAGLLSLSSGYEHCSEEVTRYKQALENLNKIQENCTVEEKEEAEALATTAQHALEASIRVGELASKHNLDAKSLERYSKELKESGEYTKATDTELVEMAKDQMRFDKAVISSQKNISTWIKDLAVAQKTGHLVSDTAEEMAEAYGDLLDMDSSSFSASFLHSEENLKLMQEALEGSEEAYSKLQEAAGKDILASIGLDTSQYEDNLKYILDTAATVNNEKLADLEAGASLDNTNFLQGLEDMVNAAGMTAQQATDYLSSMGVDAEIEEVSETVPETVGHNLIARPSTVVQSYTQAATVPGEAPTTAYASYPTVEYITSPVIENKTVSGTSLKVTSASKSSGGNIKFKGSTPARGGSNSSKKSSGGGGKGGSGGGSGNAHDSTYKERQHTDTSHERYNKLSAQLDSLNSSYQRISKSAENAFGKKRLAELDAQIKKQTEISKKTKEVRDEAERLYKLEKKSLTGQSGGIVSRYTDENGIEHTFNDTLKSISGVNAIIDSSTGVITNLDQIYAGLDAAHNRAVDAYNNYSRALDGTTVSEAQEKQLANFEKQIEIIDKRIESAKSTIDTYQSDYQNYLEKNNELLEQAYENLSLFLTKANEEVELKVKVEDSSAKILSYYFDKIADNAWKASDAIALLEKQTKAAGHTATLNREGIMKAIDAQNAAAKADPSGNIKSLGFTGADFYHYLNGDKLDESIVNKIKNAEFNADVMKAIEEYQDQLLEANKSLDEIRNNIFSTITDAFESMNDEMDDFASRIQHIQKLSENFININDILGAKQLEKTIEEFNNLQKSLRQESIDQAQSLLSQSRQKMIAIEQEIEKGKEGLRLAEEKGFTEDIEKWKDFLKQAEESYEAAQEDFVQNWEDALQKSSEAFQNNISSIIDTLDNLLSGTRESINETQESFNLLKDVDEDFVDDYEKRYQLAKLNRDINKSIDDTNNIKGKQELLKLQEKINNAAKDNGNLSERQLERMRQEYELKIAELALEEAQTAKSQVRLVRDSEGNYGYVYTADSAAVDKAQQNYEDKLYAIQKADDEYIKSLDDKILSLQQSVQDKLSEAAELYGTDSEKFKQAAKEIQDWYDNQINFYADEYKNALEDISDLAKETGTDAISWEDTLLAKALFPDPKDMKSLENYVEDSIQSVASSIVDMIDEQKIILDQNKETMEIAGSSMKEYSNTISQTVNDLTTETEKYAESAKDFTQQTIENFANIITATQNWEIQHSKSVDAAIAQNNKWIESFNELQRAYIGTNSFDFTITPTKSSVTNVASMDTGGYTGKWGDGFGRLAFLHSEELVLKPSDTKNILEAVDIVRQVSNMIDINANAASTIAQAMYSVPNFESPGMSQQNTFYVEFPNVTNSNEILEAFDNMPNLASQYINRK